MKTLYITTPIYYVNAKPHIGHAYTTIVCDVCARFHRMLGYDVKFVTGTDEHGKKIEQSANDAGVETKKFADNISALFRGMLPILNISNNDFIRTTEERHQKAVSHFWKVIADRGFIYLGEYSGWYDIRNEAYFSEEELIDGKSPLGGNVVLMKEPCYFFKLSDFTDTLLRFYEDHPDFIFPEQRRNEVVSFVKGGLKDLAISRTTFRWGIPVPDHPKHIVYVWMDALTNYLTLVGYPDNFDGRYWHNVTHVVGKEIVRFHAVYWPAFLIAANIEAPQKVVAHGWWLSEGKKMSKSDGNVQDPIKYCNLFGADALRYFLLRELSFGSDGNFSLDGFIRRYNSVLANSYGNLYKRVVSLIEKYCNNVVTKPKVTEDCDVVLNQEVESLLVQTVEHVENYALHKYIDKIEMAISMANQYIDRQKPWLLLSEGNISRGQDVLYVLSDNIAKITKYFAPVIPAAAEKVLKQIDFGSDNIIKIIPNDEILFPKIDTSKRNEFDVFED